ncbi:MAG: ABC1 kinase family protein [Magnetovibrionaceae bacterium]
MTETNSLQGRVRRYAKVGTAMGGLAAKVAGSRLMGREIGDVANAEDLKEALGGLKGPLMKVAQILATIPDVLPEEYTKELAQLQTNAPPMGWTFVKRRMSGELGTDWRKRYGSFEHEACSAASLGQVHRANSLGGKPLAVKLQYPDMASAVEADLRQLNLVFSIYRRYDKAIDPSEIHKELSARLREELDYGREARNMRLYGEMLMEEAGVFVPEPEEGLCTDRLLSMNWLDGHPILTVKEAPIEIRNAVAFNMFRAWYVPFYQYGVIHGDPHLGNYSVRDDQGINLLDFGCIRIFRPAFVGGVINLYKALRDNDEALAVHAYETWGFRDLSKDLIEVLNQWASFLYGPLMKDKVQKITETNDTQYGAQVATKVRKELNALGGVTVPREFVLMDRAAIGLGAVFTHLAAEINWYQVFHELVGDFDEAAVAERQGAAMMAAGIESDPT